ncbi:hypothetical protein OG897_28335 [Streptomyces sp. NBC_00237]|uniref:hypothetical protein n=1 Tax=Streptomyces sp. NBC_00237 TaxID=2975687 RepID=UPI002259EB76|nr:hypothetical protein [Streptomyces sp. NBC_00237]MCX5205354.1 hypothetical protein [Streptomyces sp. NBC_00237]
MTAAKKQTKKQTKKPTEKQTEKPTEKPTKETAKPGELRLVKETKIQDLIGDGAGTRLEASGVLYRDGTFLIVCDNLPSLIRVGSELSPKAPENEIINPKAARKSGSSAKEANVGYEDLAHDALHDHYFTLSEAEPVKPQGFRARVHEYDATFRPLGSAQLDFDLADANKGMEGLEWVERSGTGHLLALCEGNLCLGGKKGRTPGGGRIQVFRREGKRWAHTDTISLPASLPFEDYASVSVRDGRIAVLSQASSALWVGRLSAKKWEVDEGTVHRLPTDGKGRTVYGNPEGVSWVSADHVVIVSDRAKKGAENERFRAKDQSVHLFLIPGEHA